MKRFVIVALLLSVGLVAASGLKKTTLTAGDCTAGVAKSGDAVKVISCISAL